MPEPSEPRDYQNVFTVGIGGCSFSDLVFDEINRAFASSDPVLGSRWHISATNQGTVGSLVCDETEFADEGFIHRNMPPEGGIDHQLLVVHGQSDMPRDIGLSLALLRATEHRVAVLLLLGNIRALVKTTKMKNAQASTPRKSSDCEEFTVDVSGGLQGPWRAGCKKTKLGIWRTSDWNSYLELALPND